MEKETDWHSFTLSPGDLVYLPQDNEDIHQIDWVKDKKRIAKRVYKMVSCTKNQCFFVPHNSSQAIISGVEYQAKNKMEKDLSGNLMIKTRCIKLMTDILGNIRPMSLSY